MDATGKGGKEGYKKKSKGKWKEERELSKSRP